VHESEGYHSFPRLSSGRYRGSDRPAQEADQSLDVLGGGRQEELLSDGLLAQANASVTAWKPAGRQDPRNEGEERDVVLGFPAGS
jgi:hypothetical protein